MNFLKISEEYIINLDFVSKIKIRQNYNSKKEITSYTIIFYKDSSNIIGEKVFTEESEVISFLKDSTKYKSE